MAPGASKFANTDKACELIKVRNAADELKPGIYHSLNDCSLKGFEASIQ
jgi:hypothetical protein